ncbi:MAG: hypothetical protein ACPG8V_01105 [Alphaproteobacteria bacterium]
MTKKINNITEFNEYIGDKSKGVMHRAHCHAKHLLEIIPVLADEVYKHLGSTPTIKVYQRGGNTGNVCWVKTNKQWYVFTYDREFNPGKIALLDKSLRGDILCHFDKEDNKMQIIKKINEHII